MQLKKEGKSMKVRAANSEYILIAHQNKCQKKYELSFFLGND